MHRLHLFTLALSFMVLSASRAGTVAAAGTVRQAGSAGEFHTAIARAVPGDTVILAAGTLDLGGKVVLRIAGTADRPITIRAASPGASVLTGTSRFVMKGSRHLLLEGLVFTGTAGPAVLLDSCHHVRVSRCTFRLADVEKSSWVMITGASRGNRIDRCVFAEKSTLGNFITIEGTKAPEYQVSRHDTIDHNHFRDIGPRAANVLEAIRIGSSDLSLSSGHTLIEHNLFERCDGDPEYISIKSSDNVIRWNTFRECLGSLSLRHGNRNRVEGNYIFGGRRTGTYTDEAGETFRLGTGGVRFCGDSMVIVNNYMEGLTGREWDAVLAIPNGDADYGEGKPLTKHYRIRNALIAHNTLVHNAGGIEVGFDGSGFQGNWWFAPPTGLRILNNLIVGAEDTLARVMTEPLDSRWEGNVIFPTGKAVAGNVPGSGVLVADPRLERLGEIFRPGRESVCSGRAIPTDAVVCDIDGQRRRLKTDVGADEASDLPVRNRPLRPEDVGPHAP